MGKGYTKKHMLYKYMHKIQFQIFTSYTIDAPILITSVHTNSLVYKIAIVLISSDICSHVLILRHL